MPNMTGGKGYSPTQILSDPALIDKITTVLVGIQKYHTDVRNPVFLVRSLRENIGISSRAAYAIKREGLSRGLFLKTSREGIISATGRAPIDNLTTEALIRCGSKLKQHEVKS